MTIKLIVAEYLKENGYDGLYAAEECACAIDNLMPCGEFFSECEPGYKHAVPCADCREYDDQFIVACGDTGNDFVICEHKKEKPQRTKPEGCNGEPNLECPKSCAFCDDYDDQHFVMRRKNNACSEIRLLPAGAADVQVQG